MLSKGLTVCRRCMLSLIFSLHPQRLFRCSNIFFVFAFSGLPFFVFVLVFLFTLTFFSISSGLSSSSSISFVQCLFLPRILSIIASLHYSFFFFLSFFYLSLLFLSIISIFFSNFFIFFENFLIFDFSQLQQFNVLLFSRLFFHSYFKV